MSSNGTKRKVPVDNDIPKKKAIADQKATVTQPGPLFRNSQDPSTLGPGDRTRELIQLVKRFPHLYDKKHPLFKDVVKKNRSWIAVSEMVDIDEITCQNVWKKLYDRYFRESKKLPEFVREDFKRLMDTELKFLEPLVTSKKFFESSTPVARASSGEGQSQQNTLNGSAPFMASAHNWTLPSAQHLVHDGSHYIHNPALRQSRNPLSGIIFSSRTDNDQNSTPLISSLTAMPTLSSANRCLSTPAVLTPTSETALNPPADESSCTRPETVATERELVDLASSDDGSAEEDAASEFSKRTTERSSSACLRDISDSTRSEIAQTQNETSDIDRSFANALLEIFRRFPPGKKLVFLQKVLRHAMKVEKNQHCHCQKKKRK